MDEYPKPTGQHLRAQHLADEELDGVINEMTRGFPHVVPFLEEWVRRRGPYPPELFRVLARITPWPGVALVVLRHHNTQVLLNKTTEQDPEWRGQLILPGTSVLPAGDSIEAVFSRIGNKSDINHLKPSDVSHWFKYFASDDRRARGAAPLDIYRLHAVYRTAREHAPEAERHELSWWPLSELPRDVAPHCLDILTEVVRRLEMESRIR